GGRTGRAAVVLPAADDAPTVQVLVVKTQVALAAKSVECILHSLHIRQLARAVVVADIFGADVRERREELATIGEQADDAVVNRKQREPTVVMSDPLRRLRERRCVR